MGESSWGVGGVSALPKAVAKAQRSNHGSVCERSERPDGVVSDSEGELLSAQRISSGRLGGGAWRLLVGRKEEAPRWMRGLVLELGVIGGRRGRDFPRCAAALEGSLATRFARIR